MALLRAAAGGLAEAAISQPLDRAEREADSIATWATSEPRGPAPSVSAAPAGVYRKCAACAQEEDEERRGAVLLQRQAKGAPAETPAAPTPEGSALAGPGVVEDAAEPGPSQMRRGDFMTALRASLTALCDEELAVFGRTAEDCPYLQRWLDFYESQPAPRLLRAIELYASPPPGAGAATLLGFLQARVRAALRRWAATGQVEGVPAGVDPEHPEAAPAAPSPEPARGAELVQAKHGAPAAPLARHPAAMQTQLGPGAPLEGAVGGRMARAFGQSFGSVRVHTGAEASRLNERFAARAFTVGQDIAFASGEYRPGTAEGDLLIAHELAHTLQQSGPRLQGAGAEGGEGAFEEQADRAALAVLSGKPGFAGEQLRARLGLNLQRCSSGKTRAPNCPEAPPSPPTITTMAQFIDLVRRVEASTATGADPVATARLIARTKYGGSSWDWMLPTTKGKPGATAAGTVTADDIGSLCFKLIVTLPGGQKEDPMHVVVAIVADAETQAAGTGATGLASLVRPLPTSVSQRGASTWVGDVGKAAAEWMAAHPIKGGGSTMADYLANDAPPHDLLADIDGVAATSKSPGSGFAFDKTKHLSENLQAYFSPSAGKGRERRFHIFCSAEGLDLEKDGVHLTDAAKAAIGQRVNDFAQWFMASNPTLVEYETLHSESSGYGLLMLKRQDDWKWFANRFVEFVEKGLAAEGP